MKKYFFVIFLFFTSLYSIEYYKSNEIGLKIQKIAYSDISNHEWVLYVSRPRDRIHEKLYNKDNLVKSTEKIYSGRNLNREITVEGENRTERFFIKGRPSSEKIYINNKPESEIRYFYNGDKLYKISEYNSEGEVVFQKEYELYPDDSRLRKVNVSGDYTDRQSVYKYSYGKNLLAESHVSGDERWLVFHGDNGDVVFKEKWKNEELLAKETNEKKDGIHIVEKQDNLNDITVLEYYDNQNRLVKEKYQKEGRRLYEISYKYDGNGALVLKEKKSGSFVEEWNYFYESGMLEKEEYRRNNEIKKVIVYKTEEDYYEVFYTEGKAFLGIYYEDNKKVKEEILN